MRRAIAAAAIVLALAAYALVPRGADLRAFTPSEIGRLEAASWRHYYEKQYLALAVDLYQVSASQFRFSPWDSVHLAIDAARAAHDFQETHDRIEAARALPALRAYFTVLGAAVPRLDVDAAARAELDWWQARREAVSPDDYGLRIARVTALLYGVDNAATRAAGVQRARAMALRDRRGNDITEADWAVIERALVAAYRELEQGLQEARRPPSADEGFANVRRQFRRDQSILPASLEKRAPWSWVCAELPCAVLRTVRLPPLRPTERSAAGSGARTREIDGGQCWDLKATPVVPPSPPG